MEAHMHIVEEKQKLKNVDIVQARLAQALGLLEPLRMFLTEHPDDAAMTITGDSLWAIEELVCQAKSATEIDRA
jgi:hypothetical protein